MDKYELIDSVEDQTASIQAGQNKKYFGTMVGQIDIGVCSDCAFKDIAKSRYGNVFLYCQYFDRTINAKDPIEYCNRHRPEGQLTLQAMAGMATLINPDSSDFRQVAGFTASDEDKVKKCE